ncbi:hypothetical protein LZ32DRAFT_612968 [Colletotrichum eremochloae]|nr:hypothetical protein LZ32DRAFT_612968 [Colletotrichum eremochloae]
MPSGGLRGSLEYLMTGNSVPLATFAFVIAYGCATYVYYLRYYCSRFASTFARLSGTNWSAPCHPIHYCVYSYLALLMRAPIGHLPFPLMILPVLTDILPANTEQVDRGLTGGLQQETFHT